MEKISSALMAAFCAMVGHPFAVVPPEIKDLINGEIYQKLLQIQRLDDRIDGLRMFICQFVMQDTAACRECDNLITLIGINIARHEREIVLLRAKISPMYALYVAVASIFWGDCARSREAVI